jgi:hypothetical protein
MVRVYFRNRGSGRCEPSQIKPDGIRRRSSKLAFECRPLAVREVERHCPGGGFMMPLVSGILASKKASACLPYGGLPWACGRASARWPLRSLHEGSMFAVLLLPRVSRADLSVPYSLPSTQSLSRAMPHRWPNLNPAKEAAPPR